MDGGRGLGAVRPTGKITVEHTADGPVMLLSGDVDSTVVREQKDTFDLSCIVAVDVGELTYIDSSGLTMLVRWAQESARAGRPAEIRRHTARFGQVIDMAGLTPLFVYA